MQIANPPDCFAFGIHLSAKAIHSANQESFMANLEDKLEQEGRFVPRPWSRWPAVTVAKINMDVLFKALSSYISRVLLSQEKLKMYFYGENIDVEASVNDSIHHYCHQAMNELWNRLRNVAGEYDYATRKYIFTGKAPSMCNFEFPQFFASLLSGIGPLHLSDSLSDTIVIYAPEENSQYYGRSHDPKLDSCKVRYFLDILRLLKIPLGMIETKSLVGSYFTTCSRVTSNHGVYSVLGAFNPSYYTHDDVIMALFFGDFGAIDNPFEDLSLSVDFVDEEATVQALLLSNYDTPIGPSRHVGGCYEVNSCGLSVESESRGGRRRRGVYVLGRGTKRLALSELAHGVSEWDLVRILRYRMLHAQTKAAA